MPLISVIIPVYNTEEYVIQCLESVRNQTFKDFEAIIVNDGTKDNSAVLAEHYIRVNGLDNFRLIHKENGGICSTRNAGLDHAKGDWIFFLDSDDWIEPDCLKKLAECQKQKQTDLVIGGYQAYDQITGQSEVWSHYPCAEGKLPDDLGKLHSFSFCWGRLYKREIIEAHGIRFDNRIEYAEDNAWQFDYVRWVKRFAYVDQVLYNYRINRNGALTQKRITPKMKYFIGEHMFRFFDSVEDEKIKESIKENPRLLSVTWGVLTTSVTNDILNKNYKEARKKQKSPLAQAVNTTFVPRSKKEKLFFYLWRHSFFMLCVFVKLYYGNFEKLNGSRLIRVLSKRS